MKQPRWNVSVKRGVVAGLCTVLLAACGSDSPEPLIKSARDYLSKDDSNSAIIQLRNALQKAPNNAEARYLLGTALAARRDPASAVKELRRALDLGYPPEQTLPALAQALIDDGDAEKRSATPTPRPISRRSSAMPGSPWAKPRRQVEHLLPR